MTRPALSGKGGRRKRLKVAASQREAVHRVVMLGEKEKEKRIGTLSSAFA